MAVQVAGSGMRSARGRRHRAKMSDINVTPMVDVMLVLLIVFMIAAPLLTVGIEVDLPKADMPELAGQDEPITVSINASGELFLQDTDITLEELGPRIVAITQNNPEVRIFVNGDRGVAYGDVMTVMGALNAAGFTHIALRAELPDGTE
ncbi:MAG: protein TolR [Proteobacteria bacterium]|nr:protein TolR [Pseudomonadota bacterium]